MLGHAWILIEFAKLSLNHIQDLYAFRLGFRRFYLLYLMAEDAVYNESVSEHLKCALVLVKHLLQLCFFFSIEINSLLCHR